MALPENINTLEKTKFTEDSEGNTAVNVVIKEGLNIINIVGDGIVRNYGIVNISILSDYVDITFTNAMANTNYSVIVTFQTEEVIPMFINCIVQNKTINAMRIKFNAPVDSSNYFLSYVVIGA